MDENELAELMSEIKPRRQQFKKGESIFLAGHKTDQFGIMLSGCGHIFHEDFWGNRNLISQIYPGDIFGEVFALLSESVITVNVFSKTDCDILFIKSSNLFSKDIAEKPCYRIFIKNLFGRLARKNLIMNEKIIHSGKRTTRQKIMSFLSSESARKGSDSFCINMNRQQLADYLSVERSAMCAELSKLQKDGYITYKGNAFTLSEIRP